MENKLQEIMRAGGHAVGTFFETGSTTAAECLALAGMDYIVIDTEHGPFDVESAMEFICAAERRGMTPLVRVKNGQRDSILKMLDVGAKGLIIPNIRSIEEAKQIVSYGKYSPLGERGVAFARGCGYGFAEPKPIEEYFADANAHTMLIPQCETVGCLEDIENIAALDGVDGIFIGPYDLSTALGMPGQFDRSEMKAAVARILAAVKAAGKFALIYADDAEQARARFDQGFDAAAVNMDTILFIKAIRKIVEDIKAPERMTVRHGRPEDLDQLTEIERVSYPEAEAASADSIRARLSAFPDHFWILEDSGRILAFVNGSVTDEPDLKDVMYGDASLHDENGAWQMFFSVVTDPSSRGRGFAAVLLRRLVADARAQGRRGVVLTCKERLLGFYSRFGFVDEGISGSQHGGVVWHQMRLTFPEE